LTQPDQALDAPEALDVWLELASTLKVIIMAYILGSYLYQTLSEERPEIKGQEGPEEAALCV
jgi:hypothetical protein